MRRSGVTVGAIIADHDLSHIWDMGGYAGNEVQVVHLYLIIISLPIPAYDLNLVLVEGEAPQGQDWLGHIPCYPPGILKDGGSYLAVYIKAGAAPGEDLLFRLRPYEVFRYQKCEYLMSEDTSEGCIVEGGNGLEGAIDGAPPLCYEHMEVRVEVEAVSESLDNGYHPGHEIPVGAGLHVESDGPHRTKAQITEEGLGCT